MAKFNTANTNKTTNNSGHAAYKMKDKEKLVTQVLTSFFNEKKFYGDNSADMQETIKAVVKTEPKFIANLAVFARKEFNMRSVSHILIAYLANANEGKPYVRETINKAVMRGDDATEIMACYLSLFGKPIPNSLKKGIADVMLTFDEYTLAKYKGNGKTVKMRDLLCLCRPAPKTDEQSELFNKLLNGTLETPMTWETQLSANGNNAKTWEKLIDSGKVGYMAMLRNLRNIIEADPANIEKVYALIENPEAVRKSRQLPFRFLSAYKELECVGTSRVYDALESAIEASIENMPKLAGRTVIAVDTSGSMHSCISEKSKVRCYEIAMLLGIMANKICEDSIFYTFDSQLTKVPVSKRTNILETVSHCSAGGCTLMHLPFKEMIDKGIKADRIIIVSDNECNGGCYKKPTIQGSADEYRRKTGNDIWVHAIDLQGYGTQQFCGAKTNIIAGWSEKVLEFIKLAEQGEGSLISRIENYTICS